MSTPRWTEWRPAFAPHVLGSYTEQEFDEDGKLEPQRLKMTCEKCKQEWQGICDTGAVRSRISVFAAQHVHRDVFDGPLPKRV